MMEKRGTKVVPIANTDDKRALTAVLAVTASGEYLNPQLLYKGKTGRCHPTVTFPEGWDIWDSENRWSSEDTTKRYITKIIVPFVSQRRRDLKLKSIHPAITIFDGFCGQTTDDVVALLRQHKIIPMQLPPNCTDKLQPVDLSINKPMKDHMKQKFQQWYAAAEVQQKLKMSASQLSKILAQAGLFLDGKHWQGGQKLQLTALGNLVFWRALTFSYCLGTVYMH